MTFSAGDDLVQEFAFIRTSGGSPDLPGGVHVQEESEATKRNVAGLASGRLAVISAPKSCSSPCQAIAMRYSCGGDGIDQRILDSALPNS
jgi:hypothetical protein